MVNTLLSLLNRLTTARATLLDNLSNLDANVNTIAPESLALSQDDWTDSRAAALNTNLDANLNTIAPESTALSTAQWTNSRANLLDNLSNLNATISSRSTLTAENVWTYGTRNVDITSMPSIIESVQRGTKYFAYNAENIINVTISSVNIEKCFILHSFRTSTAGHDNAMCVLELTSSTNLRIQRADDNANLYVHWQVIEFK